jgi:hypothetical protein
VRRSKGDPLDAYIDRKDLSVSTSRLLIWQALRTYSIRALVPMLTDPEITVRTTAARELQVRGGPIVWAAARKLCESKSVRDKITGLFVLGQLGTPHLPYKQKTLALIDALLCHRQPTVVDEQALYSVGHLRQGQPLKLRTLAKRIGALKVQRGTDLAAARAFALRR